MTTFFLPASCPACAGRLDLLNAHSNGSLSIAILECHPCEREWEITARIIPHGRSRAFEKRAAEAKQASKRRARELVSA